MKKNLFILVSVFISVAALSQPLILFEDKAHDFGTIKETDGKVTHVFTFKNVGNSPLVINKVQASCGCTTPAWTKTPIEPGKTGTISAIYNPAGRKGVFSSSITITSNAAENQERLTLRGEIIPKEAVSDFNKSIGSLQFKTKTVELNNVYKGESKQTSIAVRNQGNTPVNISFTNLPEYIEVRTPTNLAPNQEGEISFSFNSSKCNQWGEIVDEIYLQTGNSKTYTNENKIQVISNVVENFSSLSIEQRRTAPIIELSTGSLNFGKIKSNAKFSNKITLHNIGQNSLELRRITNKNSELFIKSERSSIGSGKKADVKIELNSKGLKPGKYKKTITLQTNDPQNSFIVVDVIWQII